MCGELDEVKPAGAKRNTDAAPGSGHIEKAKVASEKSTILQPSLPRDSLEAPSQAAFNTNSCLDRFCFCTAVGSPYRKATTVWGQKQSSLLSLLLWELRSCSGEDHTHPHSQQPLIPGHLCRVGVRGVDEEKPEGTSCGHRPDLSGRSL